MMDLKEKEKLAELRKLERQAKMLIIKMGRIESAWNNVREELKALGRNVPNHLGDVLHGWHKKSR